MCLPSPVSKLSPNLSSLLLMNSMSSPTGVAEQFAIAEAKLRAWSSVDGEDSTDESYDEDFAGGTDSGEGTLYTSTANWGGTA